MDPVWLEDLIEVLASAHKAADGDAVTRALKYAKSLVGAPYTPWSNNGRKAGAASTPDAPFWASDTGPPPTEEVRARGANCAGFVNLIRRELGLPVPGVKSGERYAGGTSVWWEHATSNGWLSPYNPAALYPPGTLLLRPFKDAKDQGHMAVQFDSKNIIHSTSDKPNNGVCIEPLRHGRSYFKATVAPHLWMR